MPGDSGGWPADVLEAVRHFGQGDIIEGVRFAYFGAIVGGPPLEYPPEQQPSNASPEGRRELAILEYETVIDEGLEPKDGLEGLAVITSQTCDVHEEGTPLQPWIQVSPLRGLPATFAGRTLPAFLYPVKPPDLPDGIWAIDLRIEVPVEKTVLIGQKVRSAFRGEDEVIAFGDALGLRRDRAALATTLTSAVGSTLRQRRRNKDSFRKALRDEVYRVTLNIDEGSRQLPTSVRLHIVTHGPPTERVKKAFGDWWDEASVLCATKGIKLLPNAYHDRSHTDLSEYDRWIKLDLG